MKSHRAPKFHFLESCWVSQNELLGLEVSLRPEVSLHFAQGTSTAIANYFIMLVYDVIHSLGH